MRAAFSALCLTLGLAFMPVMAQAGSEPAFACRSAAENEPLAPLVLGHFRGGRIVRAIDGVPLLIWKSEYACFVGPASCARWQKKMLAAYGNVEGDRTCLPIR